MGGSSWATLRFFDVPSVPECSKNLPFNRVAISWFLRIGGINVKFLEHLGTLERLLVFMLSLCADRRQELAVPFFSGSVHLSSSKPVGGDFNAAHRYSPKFNDYQRLG